MKTLFGEWQSLLSSDTSLVLNDETTQCFYKSLEAVYSVAFAPMLTEVRGDPNSSMGYIVYQGADRMPIDYDGQQTWSQYMYNWLKLPQMADYAEVCLSSYADTYTDMLMHTIDIWKGRGNIFDSTSDIIADNNCPMNRQWLPQAMLLGDKYSELSSLEGTDMYPWWSNPYYPMYFGDPSFDGLRYTVYNGPYLPSKINRKWYCASWRALCKLLNTPSIAIGGSKKGWNWINPLYGGNNQEAAFQISSFIKSPLSSWQKIEDVLEPFDKQICGGTIRGQTMPYSVCGLAIGDAVYSSDNAAWTRGNAYFNAPLLEPLDQMRVFFGANRKFAQEYAGIQNMEYKLPFSFLNRYQFGEWTGILSTGTDVEHWGGSNPTGRWPEYSFVSKPYRTALNTLKEVCLQEDLKGNICTPPLRLVAENVFAHQWLWHSFLDGYRADKYTNGIQNAIAWTPFKFTRQHYFRDYSFNIRGSARLSTDNESNWVIVVDQDYDETSRSNFEWRPLDEFAAYEPKLAELKPNTLKYYASHSYGQDTMHGDPYPQGETEVYCEFRIPLPLSVERGQDTVTTVFDATYLSSSGYTRKEWNEIVNIVRSMFPQTAAYKRDAMFKDLKEQFDSEYSHLSTQLDYYYYELDEVNKHEASLSVDCWATSWKEAVENVWPQYPKCPGTDKAPWETFTEGITDEWPGHDPAPYENFMSCWAGTQWDLHGYFYQTSEYPYAEDVGSLEDNHKSRSPIGWLNWVDMANDIYGELALEVARSIKQKDGETTGYYTGEQVQYVTDTLSAMVEDMRQNGYTGLQRSGTELQTLQAEYPPLTCVITTDPDTGEELSSYTTNDAAWKRVVYNMNSALEDVARQWYENTRDQLLECTPPWEIDWEESKKWEYINALSSILDPVTKQAWAEEYGKALELGTEYWRQERQQISADINMVEQQISALSAWYDEQVEEIWREVIDDDPLPDPEELKKLLTYRISGQTTKLSTEWSTNLTMFTICPDTYGEPLSDYENLDLYLRDTYICDYPTTRWPYVQCVPTKYMVGLKKTALEEVEVNGRTQLSSVTTGRVLVDEEYGGVQFDMFRSNLRDTMENQVAGEYFGIPYMAPQPSMLYGSDVRDPKRWIIHDVLSVETGLAEQGIERVEYDQFDTNVKFVYGKTSVQWEAKKIWIYCKNGPTVYTDDCWYLEKTRWDSYKLLGWRFADGEVPPEYYNKPPSADDDYSLPMLSGQLEINVGQQVIGSVDVNELLSNQ